MKRISYRGIALACLLLCALSQPASAQDFRKSHWGDSRAQVIAAEGPDYLPERMDLYYVRRVDGWSAQVTYNFDDNSHLQAADYLFSSDTNTYRDKPTSRETVELTTVLAFSRYLETVLREKYGNGAKSYIGDPTMNMGVSIWALPRGGQVFLNTFYFDDKRSQIVILVSYHSAGYKAPPVEKDRNF